MAKRKEEEGIDEPIPYGTPEPKEPETTVEAEPEAPDLADQIKALEQQKIAAEQQARAAEQARQQQETQVRNWAWQQQAQTEQTQLDSVSNALAAVQAEADNAQAALAAAYANQDSQGQSDAQRRLVRAESRLATLEAGRDELQRTVEARRAQPPPQQQIQPQYQQPADFETLLAGIPGLLDDEKSWLRDHKDALLNDGQVARMRVAAADVPRYGFKRGTEEYFRFFEERLGYRMPDEEREPTERSPVSAVSVSAPVSRAGQRLGRDGERFIDLTKDQREHARISGVSEAEYADGLKRLRAAKRDGLLQE